MPSPTPSSQDPISEVVVVEDEPATLKYLCEQVDATAQYQVCAACSTLARGKSAVEEYKPKVLLTDLGLPDGDGTALIAWTREKSPFTEIAVISILGDERSTVRTIQAGASGYLLKDGQSLDIGRTIDSLLRGDSPISTGVARHIIRSLQEPSKAEPKQQLPKGLSLTPREEEILWGIAKGLTYKELALAWGSHRRRCPVTPRTSTANCKYTHAARLSSRPCKWASSSFEIQRLSPLVDDLNRIDHRDHNHRRHLRPAFTRSLSYVFSSGMDKRQHVRNTPTTRQTEAYRRLGHQLFPLRVGKHRRVIRTRTFCTDSLPPARAAHQRPAANRLFALFLSSR